MSKHQEKDLLLLILNCGSSSVKYSLFRAITIIMNSGQRDLVSVTSGQIECIGQKKSKITDHKQAIQKILKDLISKDHSFKTIDAIGHRVVHGGEYFRTPRIINKETINKIRRCSDLAPLHNPANLAGIEACQELLPRIPQVAVFDTAFHQTIPPRAYMYALPYKYYKKYNLRKFGFHGMSHQYVAREAAKLLGRSFNQLRLITCHLGNGCSMCAVKNGESLDVSMGFTPLAGLVMGTRSGDIDPAAVLYIMEKENMSPEKMENILNKQSGLKGISGISNDMRLVARAAKKGHKRAELAFSMFSYRIRMYIGSYMAIMGGVDAVIFTAGIGENLDIRKIISYGGLMTFLKQLKVKVCVIHTNEELMIAQEVYHLTSKWQRR